MERTNKDNKTERTKTMATKNKMMLVEVAVGNCFTMEQLGERFAAALDWKNWKVNRKGDGWNYTNSENKKCTMDFTGKLKGDSQMVWFSIRDFIDEPNLVWVRSVSDGKMVAIIG